MKLNDGGGRPNATISYHITSPAAKMAVLYRLALIGILCLFLLHQALGACRSCDYDKADKDCRDIYKPKDERTACIMSDNDKTKKNMCKLYRKGWKIVCKWGESSSTCKGPCPRGSAAIFTQDVTIVVAVASTLMSIHRFLH